MLYRVVWYCLRGWFFLYRIERYWLLIRFCWMEIMGNNWVVLWYFGVFIFYIGNKLFKKNLRYVKLLVFWIIIIFYSWCWFIEVSIEVGWWVRMAEWLVYYGVWCFFWYGFLDRDILIVFFSWGFLNISF